MEDILSSKIKKLIKDIKTESFNVIEEFWRDVEEQGTPLIENIKGDDNNVLITFLYRGKDINNVMIYGGVPGFRYNENIMEHIENTDVWFRTYKVRNNVKFKYNFSLNYEFDDDYKKIKKNSVVDVLNPNEFVFPKDEENSESEESISSLVMMPKVKKELWTELREYTKKGEVKLYRLHSDILGGSRRIWTYVPYGYKEIKEPCKLLILSDGFEYLSISAATVLDNLINDKKISNVICVLIESTKNRYEELTCSDKYSDFIVKELMPWIYENYNVSKSPRDTIIGGVSLGGLAATYMAYKNPSIFGNVLSQSGSYWYDEQWLTNKFKESERLSIKFYLNAGVLEDNPYDTEPIMMEVINNMRDVLIKKGYEVSYETFPSGHDYLSWGETLGIGLIELLGK
ncbi:alpha/beta hydrolase-fold protein [uncultured Clostridium sp.]|uniref:alpha/beta hydrolase-fold protein n=1 Tax=uncultured Clostridium sp. TaxID=59620 RepID=UPI00321791EE